MASNSKVDLLRGFLGSLPESVAGRLARAVEIDRLNDGKSLPHDLILESLRPTLREGEPTQRMATPMRAFCRPFEDLLTNATTATKHKGRIARNSITPVWNWLAQTVIPGPLNAYSLAIKMAVMGGRSEEMKAKTVEFWNVASREIRSKLDTESGRRVARVALNNAAVVEDAREMALMLAAGKDVCELQDRLPRVIPEMTDDIIHAFREIYDRVSQSAPDSAAYLPLIVMSRLEHPWEALRLPVNVSRTAQETLIARTDMGLVGEVLFDTIEAYSAAIREARPNQFSADAVVAHLRGFTTFTNGMVKEIELRRDGTWGQRLMKDRTAVAEVMDGFMERAPREILAAVPTHKSGAYAGGPRVPDFTHPADPEKTGRALSYAHLIAGCRSLAAAASFGGSLKNADDQIGVELEGYNDSLIRELRSAAGEMRMHADQYLAVAIELTGILFSAEEGEFLRRRGQAAVAVAA